MACPAGVEPATCGLEGRCSIQLSYGHPTAILPVSFSTRSLDRDRSSPRGCIKPSPDCGDCQIGLSGSGHRPNFRDCQGAFNTDQLCPSDPIRETWLSHRPRKGQSNTCALTAHPIFARRECLLVRQSQEYQQMWFVATGRHGDIGLAIDLIHLGARGGQVRNGFCELKLLMSGSRNGPTIQLQTAISIHVKLCDKLAGIEVPPWQVTPSAQRRRGQEQRSSPPRRKRRNGFFRSQDRDRVTSRTGILR